MNTTLYRLIMPLAVCGVEIHNGKVSGGAPLVKYMKGWTLGQVRAYCVKRRWELEGPLPPPAKDEEKPNGA